LCEIENEIAKDKEATIKDGTTIYHSRRYIVKDDEQEYLYSVHILEDITERMDIQEALQTSESQYRRLFESAKDGILILNAKTGLIADITDNKISFEDLQKNEYIRYERLTY
jgi:PAS domain-containing protein